MRFADAAFALAVLAMVAGAAYAIGHRDGELRERAKPKLTVKRPPINVHPALSVIPCPVTAHGIIEWRRTCQARIRNEAISNSYKGGSK